IQGGGPGTNEYVGYASYLRDELGTVPHPRGTVGMSTRGHDTGDAQWFVNLRDNARLVREYTVFAEVTEGIEVVDGILEGDLVATARVEPADALTTAGGRPQVSDLQPLYPIP
ncbi:MAG TPA: peptidylprolyl isomerase, partial [Longimicrobium sp.]|nr:peptidylprolyl isomerase [Longimicrobium sp.]